MSDGTLVLRTNPWDALIRLLSLGTWADGEQVVQPTVPSQECVGCRLFRAEEGTF